MNKFRISCRVDYRITLAFLAAAILGPARSSIAGLTLTTTSGNAFYGVYNTTTGGSSPVFNANGSLQAPGFSLPSLASPVTGLPTQTFNPGSLVPSYLAVASTTSNPNATGVVPAQFGTAATQIYATGSGQGSSLPQGGVLWSTKTNLADNLSVSTQAAVSVTMGTATFVNNTGSTVDLTQGTFGAVLNVKGTISGSDGSFVAAGLSTSYQLSGGTSTLLSSIVLAAQGNTGSYSTGLSNGDAGTASFNNGILTAKATSYAPGDILVANGQSITIMGVLTLISDPGSSIGIATGDVPGFGGVDPLFGIAADAVPAVVPEPSTAVLLGSGLALAGLWARSRRGRALANS